MQIASWIFKTEPETYSFTDLQKDKKTPWTGIRNPQARNILKSIPKGSMIWIYHTGSEKQIVGVAKTVSAPYAEQETWIQIDIAPDRILKNPVPLSTLKNTLALSNLPLVKQPRLSVVPVSEAEHNILLKLSK